MGTIIGNTIPIMPKSAVKIIIGNSDAPILDDLLQDFTKIYQRIQYIDPKYEEKQSAESDICHMTSSWVGIA